MSQKDNVRAFGGGEKNRANPVSLADGAGEEGQVEGKSLRTLKRFRQLAEPLLPRSLSLWVLSFCPLWSPGHLEDGDHCVGVNRPFIWSGNFRFKDQASQTTFLKHRHLAVQAAPEGSVGPAECTAHYSVRTAGGAKHSNGHSAQHTAEVHPGLKITQNCHVWRWYSRSVGRRLDDSLFLFFLTLHLNVMCFWLVALCRVQLYALFCAHEV